MNGNQKNNMNKNLKKNMKNNLKNNLKMDRTVSKTFAGSGKVYFCKSLIMLVLLLLVNFPLINALEISAVQAQSITDQSALISWTTDEAGDSFVRYGQETDNLEVVGDANPLTEHQILLENLAADKKYYYQVESNFVVDDNAGSFYSFQTLEPDTTAPELVLEPVPERVAGSEIDLVGTTEPGARVDVSVNEFLVKSLVADQDGKFLAADILLLGDQDNRILVEVIDSSGNTYSASVLVFSDLQKPKLTLEQLPEIVSAGSVTLKGTISEEAQIEIFVNNKSVKTLTADVLSEEVNLDEGQNKIEIILNDSAGWKTVEELNINSDTQPPRVEFDLIRGNEYYEGSAETDITGTTEAGAKVYLYVYSSRESEYRADFKRAIAQVTADENGNFKFDAVKFPPPPLLSLEDLTPREVPSGMQDILISPLGQLDLERKTYYVYVIAEDVTGKTGFAPQKVVRVNTCYSADTVFEIKDVPKFQAPFRLDPQLMESGQEQIQAVFNLNYIGSGISRTNTQTGEVEQPYRILDAYFQKACTQSMMDEGDYKYGCQLLPAGRLNPLPNVDKTYYYVTKNLQPAADFLTREDNPWEDFVTKRQLKFPLKIVVRYRERDASGSEGEIKTQTKCHDLGYFVDIPIDSSDLVPDIIANEGVELLGQAITQIDQIRGVLEQAIKISGITCMASFFTKMGARFYRVFMSGYESGIDALKPESNDDEKKPCPLPPEQDKLLLEDTYESWKKLSESGQEIPEGSGFEASLKTVQDKEKDTFDARCPQTAQAWSIESTLDQLYRWSCDRFLCRSVPARWTEEANQEQVEEVQVNERQCQSSANCVYLEPKENCQTIFEKNVANTDWIAQQKKTNSGSFTCYFNPLNGNHYVVKECSSEDFCEMNVMETYPGELGTVTQPKIFAFKPEGADKYCIGNDQPCSKYCSKKRGFEAVNDGYIIDETSWTVKANTGGACYKEDLGDSPGLTATLGQTKKGKLTNFAGNDVRGTKYKAGYTRDCFVDNAKNRYQCVCQEKPVAGADTKSVSVRVALKKQDKSTEAEPWVYRQEMIFRESGGQTKNCLGGRAGTCYPSWRYYDGRDLSGAFGLNYGLDNVVPLTQGEDKTDLTAYSTTRVDPHNQLLGTFQSACLPGINARLVKLQSILMGLRGCIVEAKNNGLQDAGLCKNMFTQQVCGLVYKLISYAFSDCSPVSFKDVGKGLENQELSVLFSSFNGAVDKTMTSSIQEISSDYGNAKLDQFFASGTKGFAESMCLWAFGYDFPLGMDFIMDTANAFPMETNVMFPLAERELSTFDPVQNTAVHNYNLGGIIIPGCNIRSYRTELKCVGPEDLGGFGLNCGQQGCDCLTITDNSLAGAKTYAVVGGTGNTLEQNQLVDLPIPSPQKVHSQFRYDHVVLSLFLDPSEKVENCFEDGAQTSFGGKYYFPIQDVSSPGVVSCHVEPTSGRFNCPEISSLFGEGQTYLEHPYIQCYDKNSGDYVDCSTPNLFLKDDPIVVKIFVNAGQDQACLKVTDNRELVNIIQPLPEGVNGIYNRKLEIGTVDENLLRGRGTATIVLSRSNPDCGGLGAGNVEIISRPEQGLSVDRREIKFKYRKTAAGYELEVPDPAVRVNRNNGYTIDNYILKLNSQSYPSLDEINKAEFEFSDFKFKNILRGSGVSDQGECVYEISPSSGSTQNNVGGLSVTVELLKPGAGESCYNAHVPVPRSSLGKNSFTQTIRVQEKAVELALAAGMHDDFTRGHYSIVIQKANSVVSRNEGTIEDATALYYWIASMVMQDKGEEDSVRKSQIKSMLDIFFARESSLDERQKYKEDLTATDEYKKIKTYLCQVDKRYGSGQRSGC